MDTSNKTIAELMSLIDEKARLFNDIMDITQEQKKDIFENEAENIQELVNRKQAVIDKINLIDSTFSEKLNLLKKAMNIASLEEADFAKYPILRILKLKVESIMALAGKIMEIENQNKDRLLAMQEEIRKEIKQINVGKKSLKAYETPMINSDGIYIDRKK